MVSKKMVVKALSIIGPAAKIGVDLLLSWLDEKKRDKAIEETVIRMLSEKTKKNES